MTEEFSKEKVKSIKSFMAFALRHKPHYCGIRLDADGLTSIDLLVRAVNRNKKMQMTKDQLISIAKHNSGGIFLIDGDRIGAKNGHSFVFNMTIPLGYAEIKTPPKRLYFNADKDKSDKIVSNGGFYLSIDGVILSSQDGNMEVNASEAMADGVKFYSNAQSFFTHYLSSKYIIVRSI